MAEPVLAIDFGTTTSAAILVSDAGQEPVEEPSGRGRTWPSAVFYDGACLLVGSTAYGSRRARPERYRAEFKPELGGSAPVPLGGREFAVTELVAAVLGEIRATAERAAGSRVARAVLTVPADHDAYDVRGSLMIEAAGLAGLDTVELLAEPVAAALAPTPGRPLRPGSLVLVHDLGGGTFDAALVRLAPGAGDHEVLGHAGLAEGGRDIDAALYEDLRRTAGRRLDALLGSPRARMRLAEQVVELKHRLTEAPTASDYFGESDVLIAAPRDQVSALAMPLLRRTVSTAKDLVAGCGLTLDDVETVLLAGGVSRMPVVGRTVERALGRPVTYARSPELAVVQGAARFAAGAGSRFAVPWEQGVKERPLRWRIPGEAATMLGWTVKPGGFFTAGQVLGRVRLTGGAIWELRAADDGRVGTLHVPPGAAVCSGDWLVTTADDDPSRPASRPAGRP